MLICRLYITTSVRYLQENASLPFDRQNHKSADFFHHNQGLPCGHGIAVLYDLQRFGRHGRTSQLRSFPPWNSKGSLPMWVRPSRGAWLRVHAETGHGRDRGAVGGARRGRKFAGRLTDQSASRLSSSGTAFTADGGSSRMLRALGKAAETNQCWLSAGSRIEPDPQPGALTRPPCPRCSTSQTGRGQCARRPRT